MKGKLFLIPIPLGDCSIEYVIPAGISEIISRLNYFVVENVKTARRYIRKVDSQKEIDPLTFFILNKKTNPREISQYIQPLREGYDMGVISEAGVPGVADPGAGIVQLAHQESIQVIPLVGPSSIILALMASGLNGQNFAFHGYLPIKQHEQLKALKNLEKQSKAHNQTQIFMETPYRNNKLISTVVSNCHPESHFCIAAELSLPSEFVSTRRVADWKKSEVPDLHKKPAIFLLHAY